VIRDQRGTPLGYVQSGTSYAFGTDNVGSVTSVIASSGTQVATYTYDPYGHQNSATGTDAAQNLIRYTGALYDTAASYWYLGARWQNPTTAFFTAQDSNSYLDNPSDGNRYAYASDSPVNYTDPTGHDIWGCIGAVVTGAGAAAALVGVTVASGGAADVAASAYLLAIKAGSVGETAGFYGAAATVVGSIFGGVSAC
jgi:RHS repeat-associated protein